MLLNKCVAWSGCMWAWLLNRKLNRYLNTNKKGPVELLGDKFLPDVCGGVYLEL